MVLRDIVKSNGLMQHRIRIEDVADRRGWFTEMCRDRSVLHFGCCDVPVFDADNNLHIELSHHTDRLDGLDISHEGIEVLKKHVLSDYYTSAAETAKQYDLVLVPEVLEHTANPALFLEGVFGVRAGAYCITAPDISWYGKTRRDGDIFFEQVHGDHKAWYSPYTLVNTIRPFLQEEEDHLQVFFLQEMGSVAVLVTKNRQIETWSRERGMENLSEEEALHCIEAMVREGKTAEALFELDVIRKEHASSRFYYLQSEILLSLQRNMDLFRISVNHIRINPQDKKGYQFAAVAAEGLKQFEQARKLTALAQNLP